MFSRKIFSFYKDLGSFVGTIIMPIYANVDKALRSEKTLVLTLLEVNESLSNQKLSACSCRSTLQEKQNTDIPFCRKKKVSGHCVKIL